MTRRSCLLVLALLHPLPSLGRDIAQAEETASQQGREALSQSVQKIAQQDLRRYVTRLASPEYEGRGTGDKGERMATAYLAAFFEGLALSPAGTKKSYFQTFEFPAGMKLEGENNLTFTREIPPGFAKTLTPGEHYQPLSFTRSGFIEAELVFAGFGITSDNYDSFEELDVEGKWVAVLRGHPAARPGLSGSGPLIAKANLARQKGAAGILFVKGSNEKISTELISPNVNIGENRILPALTITDQLAAPLLTGKAEAAALRKLFQSYSRAEKVRGFKLQSGISIHIGVVAQKDQGRNVVARLVVGDQPSPEAIVIGAHIDHLGYGNRGGSRARGEDADKIHYGADDNASGVAAMMELAQHFAAQKKSGGLKLRRDLIFAGWSGEEVGLLGSGHYVAQARKKGNLHPRIAAYLNLDMVGRLKENGLNVQGTGSSEAWQEVLDRVESPRNLRVLPSASPYLPTDTAPFYDANIPVLSIFTGLHDDYHTPRDTIETINFPGLHTVTRYVRGITVELARLPDAPGHVKVERARGRNAPRVRLGIQFEPTEEGIRVSGVQEGSPAARCGVREEDILRQLDGSDLPDRDALLTILRRLDPGKKYSLVVNRLGKAVRLRISPERR